MFYLFFILSLIFDGVIYFCNLFENFEFLIDFRNLINDLNLILIIVDVIFLIIFLLIFLNSFVALGASGGYPGWRTEHLRKCTWGFLKIIFTIISMIVLLINQGVSFLFSLLFIIGGIIGFYFIIWLIYFVYDFFTYKIHRL